MDNERLWVRASNNSGHSIIWMEAEFHEKARARVIYEMTNAALHYLYQCGSDPDELSSLGESLSHVLAKWWDEHNRFCNREADVPPGYDKWRVFWRPAVIPDAEV